MNTENNKRRKMSKKKIESAFLQMAQTKDVGEITVTDICKEAKVNRSTFYANYIDIFDLLEKIKDAMLDAFHQLYNDEVTKGYNSNNFLKLFIHIKDNQLFYKTYFILNFDMDLEITRYDTNLAERFYGDKDINYHMEFFRGGITYIIKKWLKNDCDLSPEQLFDVIKDEYKNKH